MKVKKCTACSGSGYYDSFGSPACSACNGLGVARGKLPYRLWKRILIKYFDIEKQRIEEIYESWK